ncbi:hypothetical protein [Vibrio cholerae]|uniref:hypothetical protein n=1 Tax=Vibrio cholerae TaxID=666 RepID=UPI0011D7D5D0|nr:hypothetical protein [Vibrio cholerae]TXX49229.1 hypothetical protein FXF14_08420 [Vibrio cholerae]
MMYYANNRYEITICPPTILKQTTEKLETLNEAELIEQGVKLGLQFTEHDITLSLSTSADEKLDEGILKIYNLSSDLVDYLLNNDRLKVSIKSNNIKDSELISHGIYDVQGVEHDDSNDDHETTIILAGSSQNIKNSFVVRSFPRATTYKTIINEVSNLLGLNVGYVDTAISGALLYPLTFAGNTHTVLTRLASLLECKFSITNNTVHFFKKDLSGEYRVSKTVYNDQMITKPSKQSKKRKQYRQNEKEKDTYTFSVLGCPIVANDIFTIEDNPEQKLKCVSSSLAMSTINGAYQSQISYQII